MSVIDRKPSTPVWRINTRNRFKRFIGRWWGCVNKEEATILKYVYWISDSWYLGYLVDYSDYWTQGETLEELEDNLADIYSELDNLALFSSDSTHNDFPLDDVPENHQTAQLLIRKTI